MRRQMAFAELLIAACLLSLIAVPAYGCQEECVVIATKMKRFILEDFEGRPLGYATVVIRSAAKHGPGPKAFCGSRFGPIVKQVQTDYRGRFDVRDVPFGQYWITYVNAERGESFFVSLESTGASSRPVELMLDHYANRCYLVDVERNTTKPGPNWPRPVSDEQ